MAEHNVRKEKVVQWLPLISGDLAVGLELEEDLGSYVGILDRKSVV